MSSPDGEEWLTVAEAARALSIDPRQVRRYAARLQPTDRTQDRTGPLRVRLPAVEALRRDKNGRKDTGQDTVLLSEREARTLAALEAVYRARIDELQAHMADLRQFNARLQAENEELRRLLPAAPEAAGTGKDTGQDTPPSVPPTRRRPWWKWWLE